MIHYKLGIGIMARAPSAGKTRLAPHLSPRRLETLRAALLADTLDVVASACTEVDEAVIFFTPPGSENEIATLAPHSFARSLQVDGDLGQRMCAALEDLLDVRRCDAALLVGSDIPFIRADTLIEAREELRARGGVVVGPAADGGYYLIGMAQVHAPLFEGIEWGTSRVLADTMQAAARCGVDTRLVRGAYDVDTIEDLRRLERDLASAPDGAAPRVRRWFSRT
jgi:rSAM/selenodomain-associated transferase 1